MLSVYLLTYFFYGPFGRVLVSPWRGPPFPFNFDLCWAKLAPGMYLRAFASAARRICRFDGAAGWLRLRLGEGPLGRLWLGDYGRGALGLRAIGLCPSACIVAILLGWRRLRFTGSSASGYSRVSKSCSFLLS